MSQFTYCSISLTESIRLGGNRFRYWLKICFGLFVLGRLRWTRPQRLIVAGVRFFRLSVSKIKHVFVSIFITSPFGRLIFLFSSNNEFRFSAQLWSIGPSKCTHFFNVVLSKVKSRSYCVNRPSFQTPLPVTISPISSYLEIDFGLILYNWTPLNTSSCSNPKISSLSSLVF